jgi:hypothetical protein
MGQPRRRHSTGESPAPDDARQRQWTRKDNGPAKDNGGRHCCRPPLSLRVKPCREGEAFAPGGFEERKPGPKSKLRRLRGPSEAEAPSGFPAGSPSGPKPWRFAAWRIRNRSSFSPPWRSLRPKPPVPRPAGFEAEASLPPDKSMDLRPGSLPLRSSRAETRSCPTKPEPKLPFRRWQRANRSPAFCRAGPESEDPVSGLTRFLKPEGSLVPVGRFTKPAAFAFAEGQARHRPPGGGFVSRPAVRFHPPCRPKATGPISAWAVAGKATLRCRKIVSATHTLLS